MAIAASVVPNLVTSLRVPLAIIFALLATYNTPAVRWTLCLLIGAIAISDWLDGKLARRFNPNSLHPAGAVLDSMADDFVFVTVSICFLSMGFLEPWFVLLVLWTRLLISFVRLLTAACALPYASRRASTKFKGLSYTIGSSCILLVYALDRHQGEVGGLAIEASVALMTVTTMWALIDFSFAHRTTLALLFGQRS